MSRNVYKLKGFLRIPHHENYLMHSDGSVYLCDQTHHNIDEWIMTKIEPDYASDPITIELDGEIYEYGRMYIDTWYGINPFAYEINYSKELDISDRIKFVILKDFIYLTDNYDEFEYGGHKFKRMIDHPDHFISEYGTIYSRYLGRPIKYWNSRSLHIKVSIQNTTYDIHRLVYQHFVGDIDEDFEVDHLYSTSRHHYSELEAVDGFENKRRYREKNNEFSEDEIHRLCKMMEDNMSPSDIYNEMNLSERISPMQLRNLTRNIKYGYSWEDISIDYDVSNFNPVSHKPNRSKSGLSNEEVLSIYKLSHQMTANAVAKLFGISDNVVYRIKNKQRYQSVLTDQNLQNMGSTTIER